jgi:uncharacterized protein (DUF58 family)
VPASEPARRPLRARLARLLRAPRRLKSSREGKYFIAITVGVGLAAINTGNNLLFLLLGWMCSVIVASGVLSELSLRGLSVTRVPPPRVFAGRPFLMGISLKNVKGRLPSFSIEIEDLVVQGDVTRPLDKKCYFLKIPAGRTQSTSYRHTFARRGLYRFEGFRVGTKFPFALFRKSRDVEQSGEVVVFPAMHPVTPPPTPATLGAEDTRARLGRRGEVFGVREARAGDDVRDVHWRSSAHRGRLMVREYEEEAQRRAAILVDNALPPGAPADEEEALERAISMAASLAAHYLGRGYAVKLIARGSTVPAAGGPAQQTRILRALALLPTVAPGLPFAGQAEPGSENLLVARRGHAPTQRPPFVGRVVEAG